ncbi:short transient receptor potential channel 7-like isoform X1 [Ostrea edulis]|uniref:short transient receptor potential channel 7-like isoform X1 n=1 Tax=Ostrea edulis TaxID=37623 RepID=UPI0020955748|nr:short transient receptor potential channel 7-like isoform X1 [Ostrea edulis]XP_048780178.1 short transient receptor potential channel 7-like isoform X1 [Ostrea edulis]
MFSFGEIQTFKRHRGGQDRYRLHEHESPSPSRSNDVSDSMPYKSHKDKKSLSRLNLAGEKSSSSKGPLSDLEEEFIFAAEFGDIPTVKRLLEEHPNFNVDFNDILGRTPLRLAVGNEHLEVVELLLDRSNAASIHEALLQAISAGHEQIAETILKHPKYRDVRRENKRFGETDYFFNTTSEDSPFSSDITPLILAAERNQFEIVQLLLLRGETIRKPHHYYCNCQECSNKLVFDQLRLAKTRLNAYRGLASSAYISLSSNDPILTAFELARELRCVAKVEKYYKSEYSALADQLSEYVVRLLDKVRGHDELEKLLNKRKREANDETYEQLSRLKLAIHYSEKKFVAHPSCQQKLVSIWYNDLRSMERSNWFFRSLMVLGVTSMYPLLAILYWFAPHSKVGRFLTYPCIKFIGHAMSFVTFLVMILISSAEGTTDLSRLSSFPGPYMHYLWYKNHSRLTLPEDFVVRTCRPELIQIGLSLWIIGMLWQEIKQVFSEGLYDYFDSLYNYLDVAVLTLYLSSFTLKYVCIWKVNVALKYFEARDPWEKLLRSDQTAAKQMYWIIADRFYWDSLDPHNIAEGLFAIANVISFTRVSYILPANEMFGPMQISIARMMTDIMKFLAIFLVILIAFMVGLHNLYWYYPKQVREKVEFMKNNITVRAEEAFGIPDKTVRTVFWSLFGRGDATIVELDEFNHIFTQYVGYWIFGAYNWCSVIVLLNMLIAMMSRSFEIIQEDSDTEWKFARSKLYMDYIKSGATLPIPFNMIPSPKSVWKLCSRIGKCFCKSETGDLRPHPGRIKDVELYANSPTATSSGWDSSQTSYQANGIKRFRERMQTTNGFVRSDSEPNLFEEKLTYKRVMKRIVKRYIFDMQRENDNNDDFDEIKQDISSFRYEILNHLQSREQEGRQCREKMDVMEQKMNHLMKQQTLLLNSLKTTISVDINQNGGNPNDVRRNSDNIDNILGLTAPPLSESAYSSLEEPSGEDEFIQQLSQSRNQYLEDIPEEEGTSHRDSRLKVRLRSDSQDTNTSPRLSRQQSLDDENYSTEDVIVNVMDENDVKGSFDAKL